MTDLKQRLRDVEHVLPPNLWPDIERRRPGELPADPRPRRLLAVVVAVVIAGFGIGGLGQAFLGNRPGQVPIGPQSPPTWSATRIQLSGAPTGAVAAGSVLWVRSGDDGSLFRLDPHSNGRVGSRVLCSTVAQLAAANSIWAVGDNANRCLPGGVRKAFTLFRVDPATGSVVREIPVQPNKHLFVTQMAAGANDLWVANWSEPRGARPPWPNGVLSRIDPSTGRVTGRLQLGVTGGALTFGAGAVWVADAPTTGDGGVLRRIDPSTMRVVSRIAVGHAIESAVFAYGSVWLADYGDGVVARVDPATDRVVARIPIPGRPASLAAWDGRLWVDGSDPGAPTLFAIDPTSNRVVARVRGPKGPLSSGFGSLWAADPDGQALWRIEERKGVGS